MTDKACVETVRLLLAATPDIFHAPCFALKGGTALNLLVQEMPRLSEDLNVVHVPRATRRGEALEEIAAALDAAQKRLAAVGMASELISTRDGDDVNADSGRSGGRKKVSAACLCHCRRIG